jgi:PAS domain S-box-containing protein
LFDGDQRGRSTKEDGEAMSEARPSPTRPLILLAEDDASFRQLIVTTLPPDEYAVLEARDGDEAWALLLARRPCLAILDIRMPGRSGLDLVRAVRAEPSLANMRVILLTGAVDAPDVAAGLAAGADAYLTKPFSPLQPLGTVQGLFDRETPSSRATDHLYWSLVESAPLALLVLDVRRDRFVVVNAATERLLRRSRVELLHRSPRELTPAEDQPKLAPALATLEAQGAFDGAWRLVRGDGTVVDTEVHASRVDVDGQVYYQGCFRELVDGRTL